MRASLMEVRAGSSMTRICGLKAGAVALMLLLLLLDTGVGAIAAFWLMSSSR